MRIRPILTTVLALSCFAALTSAALAQGSGSVSVPRSTSRPNNYKVTHTVKGIIQHLDAEKHVLTLVDEKSGQKWAIFCNGKTKFRAAKGLFESKKISESDLSIGQRVRVNFEEANLLAREIKVIKPKKS